MGIKYLLWSNERQAWWKPGEWGYTAEIPEAGRFPESIALDRCRSAAWCGRLDGAVVMVAAPENWPTSTSGQSLNQQSGNGQQQTEGSQVDASGDP